MKSKLNKITILLLVLSLLLISGCSNNKTEVTQEEIQTSSISEIDTSNYELEEMVVLSRHNIRSPLSDSSSTLGQMTTHTWYDWSSPSSELSLRGGINETAFGQYFKKYLVDKGLITEDYVPSNDEFRFYANSLQRTIATTNYFATGMFPVSDIEVEYHEEYGTMDPVFNPQLTYVSEAYKEKVMEEINALDENGLTGITTNLKDAYSLLEEVLDFKDSTYAKENNMTSFALDDTVITLEENKEPTMTGSLKLACSAADALTLQYYEESDTKEAAFGNELTLEEWKQLASIKDTYQNVLFGTYSLAINTAHPLLIELENELENNNRKFAYLCGHDSNVKGVLVSLDASVPDLPNSLNNDSPIGCKLVFEKWKTKDDKEYVSLKLVYQSADQLRSNSLLDLDNEPMSVIVKLNNLDTNEDGLYAYEDVINRFNTAINAYYDLP